jgi:hypothetical protein
MENENEITVKIYLAKDVTITQQLYLDIINGLNDRYVPCNEICLNGDIVFNSTNGFTKSNPANN